MPIHQKRATITWKLWELTPSLVRRMREAMGGNLQAGGGKVEQLIIRTFKLKFSLFNFAFIVVCLLVLTLKVNLQLRRRNFNSYLSFPVLFPPKTFSYLPKHLTLSGKTFTGLTFWQPSFVSVALVISTETFLFGQFSFLPGFSKKCF